MSQVRSRYNEEYRKRSGARTGKGGEIVTTDYMGITITFKMQKRSPQRMEDQTSVFPRRGSSPALQLALEQEAFRQAFVLKHTCPCGAFIDGDPKANHREFPDLRSLQAAWFPS